MSILFKNCIVLTRGENGEYNALKDAYLGVKGKVISYIGQSEPTEKYEEIKDMGGALLMPGLVNAHGHAAMTLVRGVGSDLNLQDWLFGRIMPIEDKMSPEDVVLGTQLAMLEMLKTGTTTYADMYSFPIEVAQCTAEAGMKLNVCRPLVCFDPEMEGDDCDRIKETPEYYKAMNGLGGGLVLADFCMHSEYLTTEKTVKRYAELAQEYNARFQVHVSETKKEHDECIQRHGLTPMAYFEKLGVLKQPVYAAHCVWLSPEDMEIARVNGVTMVHNPTSNLKLGSGFAPIPKALDMGINVALGTDGCASNNNLNMWEEMHLAAIMHKGYTGDPTIVKPAQVLDMATVNAAKAMGRPDTGVLKVGNRADIIAVDMDAPHMIPAVDIPSLLVYSAQGSDVKMTMVDGKILYVNNEFLTLDKEKIVYNFKKNVEKLLAGERI